jgi:hypothetical protein
VSSIGNPLHKSGPHSDPAGRERDPLVTGDAWKGKPRRGGPTLEMTRERAHSGNELVTQNPRKVPTQPQWHWRVRSG